MTFLNTVAIGDCRELLKTIPDGSFQCCVTSPPYYQLRNYDHPDQIGQESTPDEYVDALVTVFREVRRVLRDDGTLWLNLGDTYAEKSLLGLPWRAALALRNDGWLLRCEIIWSKENGMPDPATDRPTRTHENVFLLSRSAKYYFCMDQIRERYAREYEPGPGFGGFANRGATKARKLSDSNSMNRSGYGPNAKVNPLGRNARSVWSIPTQPYNGAHFATMPPQLVTRCILAGSRAGDAVLDPFFGSGTVGEVAESLGRKWFGCELNPKYHELIKERTAQTGLAFGVGT